MGDGPKNRMFAKPPLTREAEIEVAKAILSPDPKISGPAVEKMILHNTRLVRRVVNGFVPPGDEMEDDLIQDGMLALCEAAGQYVPHDGLRFAAYALPCITGRVLDAIINEGRQPGAMAGEPLTDDIMDTAPPPDRKVEACLNKKAIRKALRLLKPSYALVLAKRYGIGGATPMTQEAIGAELGLTRERIVAIEQAAIKAMRLLMDDGGGG